MNFPANFPAPATRHLPRIRPLTAAQALLGLFFLYLFLVPLFDLLPSVGVYNEKRLLELALLAACALLLIASRSLRDAWLGLYLGLPVTTRLLLGALPLIGLLSAAMSTLPDRAVLEVALYSLIAVATLGLAAALCQVGTEHCQRWLALALLAILLGNETRFYTSLFAAWLAPDAGLKQYALFNNFAHVRFFSQFQSWTLLLATVPLHTLFRRRQRLLAALTLFAAGSWWMMLFTSGTRGTLLGAIVALALVTLLLRGLAGAWLKWTLLCAALGLGGWLLLFMVVPALTHGDASSVLSHTIERHLTHASGRWTLWERALQMIQAHPLLGVGPMHYACDPANRIAAHPHNSLLQIAAEWGLPATLAMLALFALGVHAWARQTLALARSGANDVPLRIALLAALLTASVHALFSGVLIMPLSQVALMAVAAMMLALYTPAPRPGGALRAGAHARLLALLTAVTLATGALALPQAFQLEYLQQDYPVERWLMPRFWQQGRLCDALPNGPGD